MGLITRPKNDELYGVLIRLYPQSFRAHYSTTMVQTFNDMLENEPTRGGRLLVWARTLTDLPFSAIKEHLTNGKGLPMNRNIKLVITSLLLAIVIVGVGAFWVGTLRARQNIGVERVSVSQLGNAMQQDGFYSTYGNAAVLFRGKVSAVKSQGNVALVTFASTSAYSISCQFSNVGQLKTGEEISVVAPAGSATREPHGVLLHGCVSD